MATVEKKSEHSSIAFDRVTEIDAPIEIAFQAMLDQLGPDSESPGGEPMPMVLETRPGGRWYRDLGNDEGHLWGFVQAIQKPNLLELYGPTFMSYAAISNMQYRLEAKGNGTVLTFRYSGIGLIQEAHAAGLTHGWDATLAKIKERAEASSK